MSAERRCPPPARAALPGVPRQRQSDPRSLPADPPAFTRKELALKPCRHTQGRRGCRGPTTACDSRSEVGGPRGALAIRTNQRPERHRLGRRLRSCSLQEPQTERREHQDDPDVCHQALPEPMPEEQDVHADHDGYQREHVKHDGCLPSHRCTLPVEDRVAATDDAAGRRRVGRFPLSVIGEIAPEPRKSSRSSGGVLGNADARSRGFRSLPDATAQRVQSRAPSGGAWHAVIRRRAEADRGGPSPAPARQPPFAQR
jgi:hypothetical protein